MARTVKFDDGAIDRLGDQPKDTSMFETTVDSAAVRLWEEWPALSTKKRVRRFKQLPRHEADDFFLSLEPREQMTLLLSLPQGEQRLWMRVLAPANMPTNEQQPRDASNKPVELVRSVCPQPPTCHGQILVVRMFPVRFQRKSIRQLGSRPVLFGPDNSLSRLSQTLRRRYAIEGAG